MPDAPRDLAADLDAVLQQTVLNPSPQMNLDEPPLRTSESSAAPGPAGTKTDDSAHAEPVPVSAPDLSFLPKDIQPEFASISPRGAAWLKDGVEIKGTLTKKTQEHADEIRRMEADVEKIREDAVFGRRVRGDADLYAHLQEFVIDREKRKGNAAPAAPAGDEDDDVDPLSLTPDEFKAWHKRDRARSRAEARAEAERVYDERVEAPKRVQSVLGKALIKKFVEEGKLDPAVVERASAMCGADIDAKRRKGWQITVTPENVTDLVADFIPKAMATNESEPPAIVPPTPSLPAGPKRVATPSHGGGLAPLPALASQREGAPRSAEDDFFERVLRRTSVASGMDLTPSDLDAIVLGVSRNGKG